MKITMIIFRSLMGALFIFASITYFFNLIPQPEQTGNMKIFNDGLKASGYLIQLSKFIELVCGLAFISGRFVPLATILISPIIINILCIHIFIDLQGLPVGVFLVIANSIVAFYHKDSYKPLFAVK